MESMVVSLMIKLSERLKTVATYIPQGSILADIGSDHAYLPIYCVENGIAKRAIAGEVADGPLNSARSSVIAFHFDHLIDVRKGDGLAVIKNEDVVDCITIAGMGGALITSILEKGKDKLINVNRLVLQPNLAANQIRSWLIDHEWNLIAEKIMEEDGHIYEILVAEKGNSKINYSIQNMEKEILFGPFLLKEKNEVFHKKWQREYKEWIHIYEQLEKASGNEIIRQKKQMLKQYIGWYKEVFDDENPERS